jgi:hypothetical protein
MREDVLVRRIDREWQTVAGRELLQPSPRCADGSVSKGVMEKCLELPQGPPALRESRRGLKRRGLRFRRERTPNEEGEYRRSCGGVLHAVGALFVNWLMARG